MEDWNKFLDGFLALSNYPILTHKGQVSQLEAKLKAESEYEVYRKIQDLNFISDFDKAVKKALNPNTENNPADENTN